MTLCQPLAGTGRIESLCILDLDKPFGLHRIEILADIGRQITGRIQHKKLIIQLEHNPVSEVFTFFLIMLDRQQRQIR
ncbi:hypothetical protein SAMN05216379_1233 [Nitrosomonas eutropha]|uniref:hypothetical protein n=1 Tax=Nitrosomonas eutropha TaxID=916 RepID=UPI00088508B8|nr:hypothetical protein [Nitrosomonas eutropha]SCX24178.1 hypothetical protein SAMN05216379_1233 [Nitrosomonas eutropha]